MNSPLFWVFLFSLVGHLYGFMNMKATEWKAQQMVPRIMAPTSARFLCQARRRHFLYYLPKTKNIRYHYFGDHSENIVLDLLFPHTTGISALALYVTPDKKKAFAAMAYSSFYKHSFSLAEIDLVQSNIRQYPGSFPCHRSHIRGLSFSQEGNNDVFLHTWSIDGVCSRYDLQENLFSSISIEDKVLHTVQLDDGAHGIIDTGMSFRLFYHTKQVYHKPIPVQNAGIRCAHFYAPSRRLLLGLTDHTIVKIQENEEPVIQSKPFLIHKIFSDECKYILVDGSGGVRIGDVNTLEEWHHIKGICDPHDCETILGNDRFFLVDGNARGLVAWGPPSQ